MTEIHYTSILGFYNPLNSCNRYLHSREKRWTMLLNYMQNLKLWVLSLAVCSIEPTAQFYFLFFKFLMTYYWCLCRTLWIYLITPIFISYCRITLSFSTIHLYQFPELGRIFRWISTHSSSNLSLYRSILIIHRFAIHEFNSTPVTTPCWRTFMTWPSITTDRSSVVQEAACGLPASQKAC